jgi:hypothetical protein
MPAISLSVCLLIRRSGERLGESRTGLEKRSKAKMAPAPLPTPPFWRSRGGWRRVSLPSQWMDPNPRNGTRYVRRWNPLFCLPSAFLFRHLKRFRPCLHECLRCSERQQVPCRCCVYEHQRHDHAASEQLHHRILQSVCGGGLIPCAGHNSPPKRRANHSM